MTRSSSLLKLRWPAVAAVSAVSAVLLVVPSGPAGAADSCVSSGEFAKIHSGMTIQKLAKILDGQAPFRQETASGKRAVRWYAACDGWDPVNDVKVRYHQQVVGRRTVINKRLEAYVPELGVRAASGSPRPSA